MLFHFLPFLHLFFKWLVMTSSFGFSSLTSCSSSFELIHSKPNEVRDVWCSNQAVDLASRPSCYLNYEWVDPCVLDIPTCFRSSSVLDGFLSKVSILKPDSPSDVVATNSCNHTDQVCHDRENGPQDFFFVYTCLFNDLHIILPFDEFIMGVLRILNVASTQLHPNS